MKTQSGRAREINFAIVLLLLLTPLTGCALLGSSPNDGAGTNTTVFEHGKYPDDGAGTIATVFKNGDQPQKMPTTESVVGGSFIVPMAAHMPDGGARWVHAEGNSRPTDALDRPDAKLSHKFWRGSLNSQEVLYSGQVDVGYLNSGVQAECYDDELILTNHRIYVVWNKFPVHPECPRPLERGKYSVWGYREIISLIRIPYPNATRVGMRSYSTSDDVHESPSESLVILSMKETEMMEVEMVIREQINPDQWGIECPSCDGKK